MSEHRLPPGKPLEEGTEPDLLHYRPVSHGDLTMVSALADRLRESGALERIEVAKGLKPEMNFRDAFKEAADAAQPEEMSNPDYYRPEVEAIVAERQASEEDWVNPSLDGVDDYGVQAYPEAVELARQNRARIDAEEEEEAPWERFMAP